MSLGAGWSQLFVGANRAPGQFQGILDFSQAVRQYRGASKNHRREIIAPCSSPIPRHFEDVLDPANTGGDTFLGKGYVDGEREARLKASRLAHIHPAQGPQRQAAAGLPAVAQHPYCADAGRARLRQPEADGRQRLAVHRPGSSHLAASIFQLATPLRKRYLGYPVILISLVRALIRHFFEVFLLPISKI